MFRAAGSSGRSPRVVGWRAVPREFALVAAAVAFYFGVRGLTVTDAARARSNALDIVAFERRLHVYVEPSVQDLVDGSSEFTAVMNWVYVWGHWPVISMVLLWLVLRHPAGYHVTRNAMLLSGLAGLVVFALYPVAPPRLAGLGFVDTVTDFSRSYRVLQPPAFVNQYAAVPSLHVGWDLLMGIALVTYSRRTVFRVIGVLLPALMAFSVVATANHYILDAVLGVALVLFALAVAQGVEARRRGWPSIPTQRAAASSASSVSSVPPVPSVPPPTSDRPDAPCAPQTRDR